MKQLKADTPLAKMVRQSLSTLLSFTLAALCAPAQRAAAATSLAYPTGPMLTDITGWERPGYFGTLQNADVDGDGQNELAGRDKAGLHIWQLNRGAWIETSRLTDLADDQTWSQPSHASTIQFAHLTSGSRQSDVVARAADGIHVWHFDIVRKTWKQVALVGARPFADAAPSSGDTNWGAPEYSSTIIAADVNGDGIDELVGRGQNGLEVYQWSTTALSWHPLALSGPFANDGRADTAGTVSLQVVHGDRGDTLLSVSKYGAQLLSFRDGRFEQPDQPGPFAARGQQAAATLGSVRSFQDRSGQLWIYGVHLRGNGGAADIELHSWNAAERQWSAAASLITLPGTGWQRPSQYMSLRAGDFFGDSSMELLARSASGMHVFARPAASGGRWRQTQLIRDLADDEGFNRASSFFTLQTMRITKTDAGPGSGASVLLARGRRGVMVFHNVGGQLTQATPFPSWANSNQSQAYALISQGLSSDGGSDIRSTYDIAGNNYGYWKQQVINLGLKYPQPPAGIPSADWTAVVTQLTLEFQYVAAARIWFANNTTVSNNLYGAAAGQLQSVQSFMSTSSSSGGNGEQIGLSWGALAAQLIQQIGAVVSGPEAALVGGLIGDAIKAAAMIDSNGSNNVTVAVGDVATKLFASQLQDETQLAQQLTSYVQDWGLLQQIGVGSVGPNPPYQWGTGTTIDELTAAKTSSAIGQEIWMFQQIAQAAWHDYHCWDGQWPFGGCDPNNDYEKYPQYIGFIHGGGFHGNFYSYITNLAYRYPYPDFDALNLLVQQYGVNIYDIMMDCGGWTTDSPVSQSNGSPDANPRFAPNSCVYSQHALTQQGLPTSLAAIAALRKQVQSESPGHLADSLTITSNFIQRAAYPKPATYSSTPTPNGAPSAADLKTSAEFRPISVDLFYPLTTLDDFITAVDQAQKTGVDQGHVSNYKAEAFALKSILNDDEFVLPTLGSPRH